MSTGLTDSPVSNVTSVRPYGLPSTSPGACPVSGNPPVGVLGHTSAVRVAACTRDGGRSGLLHEPLVSEVGTWGVSPGESLGGFHLRCPRGHEPGAPRVGGRATRPFPPSKRPPCPRPHPTRTSRHVHPCPPLP